jgi:hypothetical protein
MSYHPGKTSTLMDNIEEMATNWMDDQVADFYSVDDTVNLSKEQVLEIDQYRNSDECLPIIGLALGNIINYWQNQNDDEI